MDLNAITNPRASGKLLLFKDTRPVADAVAKGLREAMPVKPVAPAGGSIDGVLSVVKAMNEGIAQLAAAIKTPVAKAAPTPASRPVAAPAVRSSGNPPSVPMQTEAQRRREADARELARKNAAQADAERVLVTKAGGRVRVLKKLDPSLSDAALMALSHIVTKWEGNGRQSVPVNGPDLALALDLPLTAAQAGYAELVNKGHVNSAKNSIGVTHVTPRIAATGV